MSFKTMLSTCEAKITIYSTCNPSILNDFDQHSHNFTGSGHISNTPRTLRTPNRQTVKWETGILPSRNGRFPIGHCPPLHPSMTSPLPPKPPQNRRTSPACCPRRAARARAGSARWPGAPDGSSRSGRSRGRCLRAPSRRLRDPPGSAPRVARGAGKAWLGPEGGEEEGRVWDGVMEERGWSVNRFL